jgi:hypothetical protein
VITPIPNMPEASDKTVAVGAQALSVNVPIGAGANLSDVIDLGTARLIGLWIPAGWTSANLSFQASPDGVTFGEMTDDTGAAISVVAAASTFIIFSKPSQWLGVRYLKVRSGSSGAPVAQVSSEAIVLFALP